MNLYKYLYFRLYSWNLQQWGKKDDPQWNALLGVSFMMFINLTTIGLLMDLIGFNIILNREIPTVEIIIIMLIILIFNYFRFVYNQQYKLIAKEFSKETRKEKLYKTLLLWLYVVASLAINFGIIDLIGQE